MTVQKELTKNIYVGNGQTTKFPFTFECPDNHPEYIRAYVNGKNNKLTETTNFSVDMTNKAITYPANGEPLAADEQLVIMRELPVRQLMNLVNNGPFFAEDIETAFDEGIMIAQQSSEKLGRALVAPPGSTTFDPQIPIVPGKTFRVSDDGTHLQATEDPGKVIDEAKRLFDETAANAEMAKKSAEEIKKIYDSGGLTPITDLAGSIGTALKRWGYIFANKVFAMNLPIIYKSVAEMKADSLLSAGMTACTLGYYAPNDGGGAAYIIRAKQEADVDDGGSVHELANGCVAELVANDWVNTLQLGLDKNDTDGANLNKISIAINKGFKIIVSDIYKIKQVSTRSIANNIFIKGANKSCGFIVEANYNYIFQFGDKTKIINIDGIIYDSKVNGFNRLLYDISTRKNITELELFSIQNCIIKNYATIIAESDASDRLYNNAEKLPIYHNVVYYNNRFENVEFYNIRNGNTAYDNFIFENNTIHNFKGVILSLGITNSDNTSYQNSRYAELVKAKKHLAFRNNTIYCDDNYILSDNKNIAYYSPIVLEGENIIFENNTIEGLKASVDCALYDSYLSCTNVYYYNNVVRNNICFFANKTYNDVMKAKSGKGVRVYKNNIFETTQEYIDMLNSSFASNVAQTDFYQMCRIGMAETIDYNTWIIRDNVFNLFVFSVAHDLYAVKEYTFENNEINATYHTGGALLYINSSKVSNYVLRNNTIILGTKLGAKTLELFHPGNNPIKSNILFENNKIISLSGIDVHSTGTNAKAVLKHNYYKCPSIANFRLSEIDSVINSPSISKCLMHIAKCKYLIKGQNIDTAAFLGSLFFNENTDCLLTLDLECLSKDVYVKPIRFYFKIYETDGARKIKWVDSNGVEKESDFKTSGIVNNILLSKPEVRLRTASDSAPAIVISRIDGDINLKIDYLDY